MHNKRVSLSCALLLCLVTLCAAARGVAADKQQTWIEVRSPHFVVVTNSGAKQGRRVADQFEQERAVFQLLVKNGRLDPGVPFVIIAVKDEKTLRALLPAYWEKKGQAHPAGLFVSGQDRYYVALRLDTEGETPYAVLYHEYVHLLVRLNYENIPLWMNEGMAEFFANMNIGDKEVTLGYFNLSHLTELRESKMLPLETLMQVDDRSPYYNEESKTSVFYSQSWALAHYLFLADKGSHLAAFNQYLALTTGQSVDSVEAARRAFGDLGQLSKKLSSYVGQEAFGYLRTKSPAQLGDKDFPTREMSAAESLAVRGDFYEHTGRPAEARNMLHQAQALDPKLAGVYETYGLLALNEKNDEEAAENFQRAVELDSHSFLAHYYAGLVAIQHGKSGAPLDQAEARLKRATELNPEFAEAYSALAQLYVLRGDKLEAALDLTRMAAKLEPGVFSHKVNIGYVLLRMQRTADAKALGVRLQALARTDEERSAAQAYLVQVQAFALYEQQRAEQQKAFEQSIGSGVQSGPGKDGVALVRRPPPSATPPAGPRLNASGKIASVTCEGFRLNLTLAAGNRNLTLHTENYYKLELLSVNWEPPPDFNPCHDLEGHDARVVYVALKDSKDAGVLLTVEVRGSGKK